mgnify:FL=1
MNYDNCMFGCSPFMVAPVQCETPSTTDPLSSMLIAYAYVPYQRVGKLYCESDALKNGTVFPELNKPLAVYGREFCQKKN